MSEQTTDQESFTWRDILVKPDGIELVNLCDKHESAGLQVGRTIRTRIMVGSAICTERCPYFVEAHKMRVKCSNEKVREEYVYA